MKRNLTVNLKISFDNPMGWSLSSVSFRMSGSGSWQNLLVDETSRRLYTEIYPMGIPLPTGSGPLRKLISVWNQAAIVRFEKEKVVPLGPIMTDGDLTILKPWFQDISNFMGQAVLERLDDYQGLALSLAEAHSSREQALDNIRTILICALTLDSWVFSGLRKALIGTYPPRDFAGTFFFWGYAFVEGPQRIFGFTTYNGLRGRQLHMIRSHGLDREAIKGALKNRKTWDCLDQLLGSRGYEGEAEAEEILQSGSFKKIAKFLQEVGLLTSEYPSRLAIPVFKAKDRKTIAGFCGETAQKITAYWMADGERLQRLVNQCSFARCSRPDVLCMLFHLAYSYAADQLVADGVIPDFPERAGGEWGVWIS